MDMEEILKKIAIGIETKCGVGGCPCKEGCEVKTDKGCMNRIMRWLKEMTETKPFEEE